MSYARKQSFDELQSLYQSADQVRKTQFDPESAKQSYKNYISFVSVYGKGDTLLDVGCGSGWSSYLISQLGKETTGLDLNGSAFEPQENDQLKYCVGSALDLPYENSSFDLVSTHECLEHLPDPEKALNEMYRVVKPGGRLILVGPNLLSLLQNLRALFVYCWKNRPVKRILFRDPAMPRHPFGNTLPEVFAHFCYRLIMLPYKALSATPQFTMRVPDTTPPFLSDNDACYLMNPIDLKKFCSRKKAKLITADAPGRSFLWRWIASGTYICIEKPSS